MKFTINILNKLVSAYFFALLVASIIFSVETISYIVESTKNEEVKNTMYDLILSPMGFNYIGAFFLMILVVPLEVSDYRDRRYSKISRIAFHFLVIVSMLIPIIYALFVFGGVVDVDFDLISNVVKKSWDKVLVGTTSLLVLILYFIEYYKRNNTLQNIQEKTPEFTN